MVSEIPHSGNTLRDRENTAEIKDVKVQNPLNWSFHGTWCSSLLRFAVVCESGDQSAQEFASLHPFCSPVLVASQAGEAQVKLKDDTEASVPMEIGTIEGSDVVPRWGKAEVYSS